MSKENSNNENDRYSLEKEFSVIRNLHNTGINFTMGNQVDDNANIDLSKLTNENIQIVREYIDKIENKETRNTLSNSFEDIINDKDEIIINLKKKIGAKNQEISNLQDRLIEKEETQKLGIRGNRCPNCNNFYRF